MTNIQRLYLFKFLVSLHFFSGVLVPFFTDWGGITLSQTLLIQSWFLVWSFLLELPTGMVADYIGRKQSIYLGALSGLMAVLIYGSYPALSIFLLAEFFFAVAFALMSGADEAFLYDALKAEGKEKQINKAMVWFDSFPLIALVLAGPVGSWIGEVWGPRYSMMLVSIPMFAAFLVGLTLKEPRSAKATRGKESTRYFDFLKEDIDIMKRNRTIQRIAWDLAIVHSLSFLMIWLYQPLLQSLDVPLVWFGFVFSAITIAEVVVMQIYNKWNIKIEFLLSLTAVIPGIAFVIAGIINWLPAVVVMILVVTGLGLTRRPLVAAELNAEIPSEQRATVLSAVNIVRRIMSAGLNPIIGLLLDRSLTMTLVVIGMILTGYGGFRLISVRNKLWK